MAEIFREDIHHVISNAVFSGDDGQDSIESEADLVAKRREGEKMIRKMNTRKRYQTNHKRKLSVSLTHDATRRRSSRANFLPYLSLAANLDTMRRSETAVIDHKEWMMMGAVVPTAMMGDEPKNLTGWDILETSCFEKQRREQPQIFD